MFPYIFVCTRNQLSHPGRSRYEINTKGKLVSNFVVNNESHFFFDA